MRRHLIGVLVAVAAIAASAGGGERLRLAATTAAAQTRNNGAGPAGGAMFEQYCVTCHNDRLKTGGLTLAGVDPADLAKNAPILEKVVRKLEQGTMPPEGRPRPDQAAVDAFVSGLEQALDRHAAATPNAGRVVSHRLNRAEYANVIQDLLGLEVNAAELLPGDMAGFGFDNNADVLAITPGLMARYMSAATKVSRLAVGSSENRAMTQVYKLGYEQRGVRAGEQMPFATHGGLAVRHVFPLDGEYVFAIRLKRAETTGTIEGIAENEHEIGVRIDNADVRRFRVGGKYKGPDPGELIAVSEDDTEGRLLHDYRVNADKELEVRVTVKAGTRLVSASFTDIAPSPFTSLSTRGGPGGLVQAGDLPGIDTFSISGPFNGKTPDATLSRRKIFVCRPSAPREEDACARKIVSQLTRQAYRRPVVAEDVDPLLSIYRNERKHGDFDAGIERALEALLSSPMFLIRSERAPRSVAPGQPYRVTDVELASRLSFFLWRSQPDDELLQVAERGELKNPAVLERQVRRLLADRRSTRFTNDFIQQWLEIRNLNSLTPDGNLFSTFDDTLRKLFLRETELFFESQLREDRPIPELLNAKYTFLNEQLANHYGLAGVYGSHFRRVALTDDRRFGLLGQGSVLTVTSYANRTSVVLRGKWILENVVGAPPPPPPPNVPPLKENDGKSKPTALRERMEQHRASPVCASCHSRMDPLGFALEHFDAVGRWRENDMGADINTAISLKGQSIDNPAQFRDALLKGPDFVRTVTEKMLIYALGRGLQYFDAPVVRQLVRDNGANGGRWSSLVLGIVKSAPFQMRTVPAEVPPVGKSVAQQQ